MTNQELLEKLKTLREIEKLAIADILKYLAKVDRRQAYIKWNYSSLHSFCMKFMGYTKDEAYPRIQACRLVQALPETVELVHAGSLTLSNATRINEAFIRGNKDRKKKGLPLLTTQEKREVLQAVQQGECCQVLAGIFPQEPRENTKPITAELTQITFAATKEQMELYEELKNRLAHTNYSGRWDLLFHQIAKMAYQKLNPKPRKTQVRPPKHQTKRCYISIHTVRKLREHAEDQCEWRDSITNERCDCKHGLQVDHIIPLAYGGTNDFSNLRMLCGRHNRYAFN